MTTNSLKLIAATIASGLFSLAVAGCANHKTHQFASGSGAVIQDVTGTAEVSSGGRAWSKAQTGTTLNAGGRVRTSQSGTVTLNLGSNGGSLEIMPGSLLELEQIGPNHKDPEVLAILDVLEGRVKGDTKNPPSSGKIIVHTRGGTYEIR